MSDNKIDLDTDVQSYVMSDASAEQKLVVLLSCGVTETDPMLREGWIGLACAHIERCQMDDLTIQGCQNKAAEHVKLMGLVVAREIEEQGSTGMDLNKTLDKFAQALKEQENEQI